MTNPAFIVEGQMEQRIISQICRGQPVRRLNCNGDNVTIERVCDFIETLIRSLGNRNFPIIILFDRENREASADEIAESVKKILDDRGLDDHDIRVFVADRETEDWYLYDIDAICAHYKVVRPMGALRGKGGLARLLRPSVIYHETSIGVEIFSLVSKRKLAASSQIFASLVETAQEIECAEFLDQNLL